MAIFPYSMVMVFLLLLFYLSFEMVSTYQQVSHAKQGAANSSFKSSHKWHIEAEVVSLPVERGLYKAWYFTVKPIVLIENGEHRVLPVGFPKKIRLAWYQSRSKNRHKDERIMPKIGEHWRLWIKLKPIHSRMNPSSFDYEKWAFVKRIDSRGYILNPSKKYHYKNELITPSNDLLSQWRSYLRAGIDNSENSDDAKALIKALMIGDKSALSQTQWDAFRDAGISHLLAISGLHIGLVALFMGWLWSRLWRCSVRLCRLVSAPYIWFVGGLFSASIYAFISGFEVPVQRALIMLTVTFVALIYKRHIPSMVILLCAFMAVMLFDIRSFYATGFWLSFVSVAIILLLLRGRNKQKIASPSFILSEQSTWVGKWRDMRSAIYALLKLHLAIAVCLIPLLLFFFQTASVISPVANLIVTPVVGTVVIPLIIIAIFLSAFPVIFTFIVEVVGALLTQLNSLLIVLVQWLDFRIQLPSPMLWVTILTTILLLLLFISTDWRKCLAALVLSVLLLYPYPTNIAQGRAEVNVLDVGQGLSVVVFTKNYSLIYDFGNLGAGRSVIYTFMNAKFRKANKLITSHHDIDHYGGAEYIATKYPEAEKINWQNCSGEWLWDGVHFQLWQYSEKLQRQKKHKKIKDNNLSCVMKITANNGQSMLLTADIEKEAEKWLLKTKAQELSSDVLLVPHQGSKTSSIKPFIEAVNPQFAIVSAGFQNHFRHPHASVVKRYEDLGITLYDTMCSGMISVVLGDESLSDKSIQQYRKENNNFWLRQC